MAKNITLLGASFPDVPSVVLPTAEGSTAEFFDTTDATLDNNAKMLSGYTAYANGVKYSGTIPVNNHTNVTVSGATVTTASGYYSSAVTKSVISGELQDITFPAAPSVSVNTLTGMVTVSYSKTFSGIKPVTKTGYIPSTASISALIYGTSSYSLPTISGTTITPTDAFQTAIPAGTFATGDINVAAIPSDYLGPGVVPVSATDITFSGSEVTIPSGYYSEAITSTVASGALADVALGGALAGQATANYSQISTIPTAVSIDPTTGEVTATFSKSFSGVTPVGSAGFLSTGASHNVNVYGTGTYSLSTVGARTIVPTGVKRLVVSSGYYTTGDVYVKAIPSTYVGSGISRISGQTIIPSSGSVLAVSAGTFTTGNINVGAIPSAYIIPSGTVTIIKNGIYDVASWNSVNATIMPNLQSISITPSVDEQIVTPPEEEVGKNQIACNDVTFTRRINIDFSTFAVGDTCHLYGRMYLSNGNNSYYPITIDENFSWEETNIRTYQVGNTNCYKITLTNSYISFEALKTNYGGLYVKGVDYDPYFHVYKKSYDGFSQVTVGAIPSAYIIPNGTLTITSNGVANVESYASVNVSVAGGSGGEDRLDSLLNRTIGGTIYNSTMTSVSSYLFMSCTNLAGVEFPSATTVGVNAFDNCQSLAVANAPMLSSVGSYAFRSCFALEEISFPLLTSMGNSAFAYCSSITKASFSLLSSISIGAFPYCSSLSEVYIPNASSIGTYAFYSCTSLLEADFPLVKSIAAQAFGYCTSLTSVSFPICTSIAIGAFSNCSSLSKVYFPSATYIGYSAFADCSSLTEANFPLCTSAEGSFHFYKCVSLSSVSFPLLRNVAEYMFAGCGLISVYMPSVTLILGSAFSDCPSLTTVNFPLANTIYTHAFQSCYSLSDIQFPLVTSIRPSAFRSTSALVSIGSSCFPALKSIGSSAFAECRGLEYVYFPMVTSIGTCAFLSCNKLESMYFPSATFIGASAFGSCSALSQIPSTAFPMVNTIGGSAFIWCSSLTSIDFPEATTISFGAFKSLPLTTVNLPKASVIGQAAFEWCKELTTISLPALTSLGSTAFQSCSKLQSIYLFNSVVATGASSMFLNTKVSSNYGGGLSGNIYVRQSLLQSWKAAAHWSYMAGRFVGLTDEQIAELDAANGTNP